MVVDSDLKIHFANPAFGILMGRRAEDFVGHCFKNLVTDLGEQGNLMINEFIKCFKNDLDACDPKTRREKSLAYEARDPLLSMEENYKQQLSKTITLKDRVFSYRLFDASVEGNNLSGMVLSDLTEMKEFLERMSETENMASLRILAAGIAHEMNNPLYSLTGFSEIILKETDIGKIKVYASKIKNNCDRLVQAISKFTSYVHDKKSGAVEETDIVNQIEAAIDFASLPYRDKKVEIEKDFSYKPFLRGDPEEIRQIFINIINNSIQAIDPRGKITITLKKMEEQFRVSIVDNGPGISPENLQRIFNPFFTTKKQGEGTGLGLSIAQRLIEKYKGNIEVKSQEGVGTTVNLMFSDPSRKEKK